MKTPQEKKRLSYAKDRRNAYGENSEASRKGVALFKARGQRRQRHEQDVALRVAGLGSNPSQDALTAAELLSRQGSARVPFKRKWPDRPLSEHLERQVARRRRREGL